MTSSDGRPDAEAAPISGSAPRDADSRIRSSDWYYGFSAAAGVVAVAAVGFLVVYEPWKSAPLYIPKGSLDFGTVWARSDFRWVIPVENNTDRVITIEHVEPGCECTTVSPRFFSLTPGERQEMKLLLDLLPEDREFRDNNYYFAESLDLFGEGRRPLGRWRLEGIVQYPFVGSVSIVFFHDVPTGERGCRLRHDPEVVDVALGRHSFPGTVRTETDGVRRATWVFVKPAGDLLTKACEYEIPLIATTLDGTQLPAFPLRASVRGESGLADDAANGAIAVEDRSFE